MKDIFQGSVLPKTGRSVRFGFVYACDATATCEYERSFETAEAAETAKLMHCRTAGGVEHDEAIVDHLLDASPLSWVTGERP